MEEKKAVLLRNPPKTHLSSSTNTTSTAASVSHPGGAHPVGERK